MSIDCAFFGFLAADAEQRTSRAGKNWVRLRVGVGKDEAVQWVGVAVFGKAAETAGELKKSDRVYIEGTIKLELVARQRRRRAARIERRGIQMRADASDRSQQAAT